MEEEAKNLAVEEQEEEAAAESDMDEGTDVAESIEALANADSVAKVTTALTKDLGTSTSSLPQPPQPNVSSSGVAGPAQTGAPGPSDQRAQPSLHAGTPGPSDQMGQPRLHAGTLGPSDQMGPPGVHADAPGQSDPMQVEPEEQEEQTSSKQPKHRRMGLLSTFLVNREGDLFRLGTRQEHLQYMGLMIKARNAVRDRSVVVPVLKPSQMYTAFRALQADFEACGMNLICLHMPTIYV
jgi:hypothetical protein